MSGSTVSRRAARPKSPARRKSRTMSYSPKSPPEKPARPCCPHCGQRLSASYHAKALRAALAEVTAEQQAKRERSIEIRRAATAAYFGPQFERWWAIAFRVRLGKHFADGGDHSTVVGHDTLAATIALEFPEFADEDGTQRLWDFLMSEHDPMPPRAKLLELARDRLEYQAGRDAEADRYDTTETPF